MSLRAAQGCGPAADEELRDADLGGHGGRLAGHDDASRGGTFTWHVNPSTRPVVMENVVERTEEQEVRSESFTGGQTTPGSSADHPFTVTSGDAADLLRVSLVQVGTSGGLPGEKELVELADPVGDYVLRVVTTRPSPRRTR